MGKKKKRNNEPSRGFEAADFIVIKPIADFFKRYPDTKNKNRFIIFDQIGYDCVHCGLAGTHIVWWEEKKILEAYHHDLAGINDDGQLVMITIDHIHPRSKGGKNSVSNYQPLCYPCNQTKADKVIEIK